MLAQLSAGDATRLTRAMATIETVLEQRQSQPAAVVLRSHRVGDMGWVISRQAAAYAADYNWDISYEALIAEICAQFIKNYDAAREHCWIAEVGGEPVGSIFLVKATDEIAKLRLLQVEKKAPGTWRRSRAGRAMPPGRTREGLQQDDAVDAEHPRRRPRHLSERRIQAGEGREAPQLRCRSGWRDLGAGSVDSRLASAERSDAHECALAPCGRGHLRC